MNAAPSVGPVLIAVVGGSGSGKSWLADRLANRLGKGAARLSLDEFYLDRSHLPPGRRAQLNFDHPRAIDWVAFEAALRRLSRGRKARIPCYNFATHSRSPQSKVLGPMSFLIVDGLWLLRRPAIRRMFSFAIFLDCPRPLRLRRRIARDRAARGRTSQSVKTQFRNTVQPMHRLFVAPQKIRADLVLSGTPGMNDLAQIAARIRDLRRRPKAVLLGAGLKAKVDGKQDGNTPGSVVNANPIKNARQDH